MAPVNSLKRVQLVGRLVVSGGDDPWGKLQVPQAIARGLFASISDPGVRLPDGKAHISVFTTKEIEKLGGREKIKERGRDFHFTLGTMRQVNPSGWPEMSRVYFATVQSPELKKLRKSYGLTPLLHGSHPFHITVGVKPKMAKAAAQGDEKEEEERRSWFQRNRKLIAALLAVGGGAGLYALLRNKRKAQEPTAVAAEGPISQDTLAPPQVEETPPVKMPEMPSIREQLIDTYGPEAVEGEAQRFMGTFDRGIRRFMQSGDAGTLRKVMEEFETNPFISDEQAEDVLNRVQQAWGVVTPDVPLPTAWDIAKEELRPDIGKEDIIYPLMAMKGARGGKGLLAAGTGSLAGLATGGLGAGAAYKGTEALQKGVGATPGDVTIPGGVDVPGEMLMPTAMSFPGYMGGEALGRALLQRAVGGTPAAATLKPALAKLPSQALTAYLVGTAAQTAGEAGQALGMGADPYAARTGRYLEEYRDIPAWRRPLKAVMEPGKMLGAIGASNMRRAQERGLEQAARTAADVGVGTTMGRAREMFRTGQMTGDEFVQLLDRQARNVMQPQQGFWGAKRVDPDVVLGRAEPRPELAQATGTPTISRWLDKYFTRGQPDKTEDLWKQQQMSMLKRGL